MNGTLQTTSVDAWDLAFIADWLSQQFLEPPDASRLRAARAMQGQVMLHWMGDFLDQRAAADVICQAMISDTVDNVIVALQRRHTALFSGIFRQRGVSPYASAWDGTGHLYGDAVQRMQNLLATLDVHLPAQYPEPADHLSIQLAALAEALRQERADCVHALMAELTDWSSRFADALAQLDENGFYGNTARLLAAMPHKVGQYCGGTAMFQESAAMAARIEEVQP